MGGVVQQTSRHVREHSSFTTASHLAVQFLQRGFRRKRDSLERKDKYRPNARVVCFLRFPYIDKYHSLLQHHFIIITSGILQTMFSKTLLLALYVCVSAAAPLELRVFTCTPEDAEQGRACMAGWSTFAGNLFADRKPGICVTEHQFLDRVCPISRGRCEG